VRGDLAERWKGKGYEATGEYRNCGRRCPPLPGRDTLWNSSRDQPAGSAKVGFDRGVLFGDGISLGIRIRTRGLDRRLDHREDETTQGIEDARTRLLWQLPGKDPIGWSPQPRTFTKELGSAPMVGRYHGTP
jgi:hypothetical protein